MKSSEFEWDDEKAERNFKKHGVGFEEGATIFNDPMIATIDDPDHSENEARFISIGTSVVRRLLTVIHTFRKERIRLISARKVTKNEKKYYKSH